MYHAVGEAIRQLRRQQSLTQTDLGGDHFSKSYVSAVEREVIVPSTEALRFFATQLQQEEDFFPSLVQQHTAVQHQVNEQGQQKEEPLHTGVMTLLDVLVQQTQHNTALLFPQAAPLSKAVLTTLPQEKQAQALFLLGHAALQQQQPIAALSMLEQALGLAPVALQPAILNEMGICYGLTQEHETACRTHQRALTLLQQMETAPPALLLNAHLHCASAYRALGSYQQARIQYEQARRWLSSQQDVKTTAQVYFGLGYCISASVYQHMTTAASTIASSQGMTTAEIEGDTQQALSLLMQSRLLYQACNDGLGEVIVRLTQAMVLLDLCTLSSQTAYYQTYLHEVEEQCRQVLLGWQEKSQSSHSSFLQQEDMLWTAFAYLTRATLQHAVLAQRNGDSEITKQKWVYATHLCQELLNMLSLAQISSNIVQRLIDCSANTTTSHSFSLAHLIKSIDIRQEDMVHSRGKMEAFYAIGEVMEELGHMASTPGEAHECYQRADHFLHKILAWSEKTMIDGQTDGGERIRRYQRYISRLEERSQTTPALAQETTQTLITTLKEALILQQHSMSYEMSTVR